MNTLKSTVVGCLVMLALNGFAQQGNKVSPAAKQKTVEKEIICNSYDPLIPQLFAFDKDLQIFAGINNTNNTVDIISHVDGLLMRDTVPYVVDIVKRRHDVQFIYRPQSVAIYDGKIVVLASHRDSCYLAILNPDGTLLDKHTFEGRAFAFSYDQDAKVLYVAGENAKGYDVSVIELSNGFEEIDWAFVPSLHYQRPMKSEEISEKDPTGIGMTVIAMSVVFLGLLTLYLIFKWFGRGLMAVQNRRAKMHAAKVAIETGANSTVLPLSVSDISGEEFAAIATAIFMYDDELHDEESTIMTINKVARTYSPWCSKLYFQNQYFNKRR
jgi:hypothetical protein